MLMAEELRRLSSARPTSMLLFQVLAIGLVTLALATIVGPRLAHAESLAAWVELIGPGRDASIRVIVSNDAGCPTLTADGESLAMRVRAEPGPIFTEGDFDKIGCAGFGDLICSSQTSMI
jgi:hypothetical protein